MGAAPRQRGRSEACTFTAPYGARARAGRFPGSGRRRPPPAGRARERPRARAASRAVVAPSPAAAPGRRGARAHALVAGSRSAWPRPAGRSGCATTHATWCPARARASSGATANSGVPRKAIFTLESLPDRGVTCLTRTTAARISSIAPSSSSTSCSSMGWGLVLAALFGLWAYQAQAQAVDLLATEPGQRALVGHVGRQLLWVLLAIAALSSAALGPPRLHPDAPCGGAGLRHGPRPDRPRRRAATPRGARSASTTS